MRRVSHAIVYQLKCLCLEAGLRKAHSGVDWEATDCSRKQNVVLFSYLDPNNQ